ncbi:threonyl-tRNA synthetase [Grimontia sp. S25]|uniref:Threonyl-tRNA synthetase n=1 Tax=Grimontia sedimenti TaxID=2711294 RepID=A0A6M1R9M9_9GAMM|nr:threonyl-tRNA synthetase [Grimontia sedimenti]NGN97164.1 threonyl-tRNA synthetase [Grimontia sedimenti]
MDKVMLIPSAILGLLLVVLYLCRCLKTGTEFNHAVMINSVFQASGIVCGIFLIAGVFFPEAKEMISGIDIYIFVSGLAVFAVSAQGFHRDAIQPTKERENSNDQVPAEENN